MTILTNNLFEQVLINPVINDNCDTLNIVSGYASPSMAVQQLSELKNKKKEISVNLITGMVPIDGILKSSHLGFKRLMEIDFNSKFQCSYIQNLPPVHSKIYIWSLDFKPISAYTGSANYTLTGFGKTYRGQKEILTPCDPDLAFNYFNKIEESTIYCNHIDAENFVTERKVIERQENDATIENLKQRTITISFLSPRTNDDVPPASSLNWGHRKTGQKRNLNEACIPISTDIHNSNFFPPAGIHFNVYADDDISLLCIRGGTNGKNLSTSYNYSQLGEYFRNRLSLASGVSVTKADLERYGRTDVSFTKIDDENYFMDFSVT